MMYAGDEDYSDGQEMNQGVDWWDEDEDEEEDA